MKMPLELMFNSKKSQYFVQKPQAVTDDVADLGGTPPLWAYWRGGRDLSVAQAISFDVLRKTGKS